MEISIKDAKDILLYIINNNRDLQDRGQFPVSVSLCGEAGIGKTAMVDTIAKELDYNYIKLNLSQISDPSDLVGWPCKQHYACKDGECSWISAELIQDYIKQGWVVTDEIRMGYAIPQWLKCLDPHKGTILLLDDFTRASGAVLQAVMEIICRQEYISWKLPKYTTIILSENPDGGDYNVSSMDEALASRYMKYNVKFDISAWSEWAENAQLDSRLINFLLCYHSELMEENAQHKHPVNARNYVMFGNTISGIKDWNDPKSLAFIHNIASGSFVDDKDNIVGRLFTTFVANKLDKLITPADLLLKPWNDVRDKIKSCVYKDGQYQPAIASILHTRLLNYAVYYFSQKGAKTDVVQERLLQLIDAPDEKDKDGNKIGCMLFSEDFLFSIIKTLVSKFPARTNKLMLNPKIARKIML